MPYLPTLADVAALVWARTRNDLGVQEGTFTAETRPTATHVTNLIANEASLVLLRTGNPETLDCADADSIRTAIKTVVAKRVAAIVEASLRPDEVDAGRTVADFYEGSLEDDLEALDGAAAACRAAGAGEVPSEVGDVAPAFSFPPPTIYGRW
jgi:hypothetical protein